MESLVAGRPLRRDSLSVSPLDGRRIVATATPKMSSHFGTLATIGTICRTSIVECTSGCRGGGGVLLMTESEQLSKITRSYNAPLSVICLYKHIAGEPKVAWECLFCFRHGPFQLLVGTTPSTLYYSEETLERTSLPRSTLPERH